MTNPAAGRIPPKRTVAEEQFRVVGLAARREMLAVCAVLVIPFVAIPLLPLFGASVDIPPGETLPPGNLGILALLVAVLSPLAVWKGERTFGESQLWTLPVDHGPHARAKVAAGWLWLMAIVALGLLAICGVVLLVDGTLGEEVTRRLIVDPAGAAGGDPGALRDVLWSTPWWHWLVPFTAATITYLAATSLWIGTRHPVWWIAAGWAVVLVVGMLSDADVVWAESTIDVLAGSVDLLFLGGTDSVREWVTLQGGERVLAWSSLPSFRRWVWATAAALGSGVLAVWAATARHREG